MPTYKFRFKAPEHVEQVIVNGDSNVIGTVRLKPSGISWKPKGKHKFLTVSLDEFHDWITDPATSARETRS